MYDEVIFNKWNEFTFIEIKRKKEECKYIYEPIFTFYLKEKWQYPEKYIWFKTLN